MHVLPSCIGLLLSIQEPFKKIAPAASEFYRLLTLLYIVYRATRDKPYLSRVHAETRDNAIAVIREA